MIEEFVCGDEIARANPRLGSVQLGNVGIRKHRCFWIVDDDGHSGSIAELLTGNNDAPVNDVSFNGSHTVSLTGRGLVVEQRQSR